jgi:hypothetical protein
MKSILISVSIFLLFCTSVLADTAHINYVSSTSDQYTQLKSELEDLGYTVTGLVAKIYISILQVIQIVVVVVRRHTKLILVMVVML